MSQPLESKTPASGLEDPRTISPAPEGVFPEPVEPDNTSTPETESETDRVDPLESPQPAENARGIVDPRARTLGPDI